VRSLWIFSVEGIVDLTIAIALANAYGVEQFMGVAYWIPAFWVSVLLVTHALTIVVLLRPVVVGPYRDSVGRCIVCFHPCDDITQRVANRRDGDIESTGVSSWGTDRSGRSVTAGMSAGACPKVGNGQTARRGVSKPH
jgi:hypothetical protein